MWKVVINYPDYSISDSGKVKNNKTNKILKQYDKTNYLYVKLYNKFSKKMFAVHRLVALSFIDNPNNFPQVNHKDENTHNNSYSNLEWCTAKYNSNYGNHNLKLSIALKTSPNNWSGRKHSESSKLKMKNKKIGKPSLRKREIMINNKKYESVTSALHELKISTRALYKMLSKGGN